MNLLKIGPSVVAALLLTSCQTTPSSPKFTPWLGSAEVFTGTGGSMTRVDGMEVWEKGSPPRKIQLVGYIAESKKAPATVEEIVALARQQSGQAIVHIQAKDGVKYWAVYKYPR